MILGIIPARGGSKRCPRKNLREFRGQPLIAWSIEAARGSLIDRFLVSTEDDEIAALAKSLGADVLRRPAELADDLTLNEAVLRHALSLIDAEWIVLLQPTSPLRTTDDINQAIALAKRENAPIVSGSARGAKNGALYIAPARWIEAGHSFSECEPNFFMPEDRSLDIDYAEQFQ